MAVHEEEVNVRISSLLSSDFGIDSRPERIKQRKGPDIVRYENGLLHFKDRSDREAFFKLCFGREILYYIDEHKGEQSDVNLIFALEVTLFTDNVNNPVVYQSENAVFRIERLGEVHFALGSGINSYPNLSRDI